MSKPGTALVQIERVYDGFDPFFTTKPIGHGRGLGLDAARRIVQLMDGQIEFDSVAGRTEFRVSLPIDRGGSQPVAG